MTILDRLKVRNRQRGLSAAHVGEIAGVKGLHELRPGPSNNSTMRSPGQKDRSPSKAESGTYVRIIQLLENSRRLLY
jgi:hypothetical protein